MTQFERIAIGIAAALAVHLLLLVWIAPRKQRSYGTQPLQVRLLHTGSTGSAQAAEPLDAAGSKRPVALPVRRRTARRERPDASAPVLPAPERTDTTAAATGSPRLSLILKEPLSIFDSGTRARAEGPTQERPPAEEIAEQKAAVERRIGSWVAEAKAAQRLEVADVYWREAAAVLERGFHPDAEMFEHSAGSTPAAPPGSGSNLPAGNSLQERLNDDLVALPNEARGLESVSLAGAPRATIRLGNVVGLIVARNQRRVKAAVSIAHSKDGSVSAVTLAARSGNAAYDRLALENARLLDRFRDPERRICRSVWVFETVFTTLPTSRLRSHVQLAALY